VNEDRWIDHVTFTKDRYAPVQFCCDGFGSSGECDPWCSVGGDPEAWRAGQHWGELTYGDGYCNDPHCCPVDEDWEP
jgi:hypothetical protein